MGNLKALLRPTPRRKRRHSDDEVQEGIPQSRQESSGNLTNPAQHLQSAIGNQAVMRLMRSQAAPTSPADQLFRVGNKEVQAGQMRRQEALSPPKTGTASVMFALTAGGSSISRIPV